MREIERLPRQITNLSAHEVRTNLLFTMSNRTSGKPRSSPQTFLRMTFSFISTRHLFQGRWWSRTGSNRRHPACKAGALPAELRPLIPFVEEMVGLGGLEPPTSRLSSARSNQLSYKPLAPSADGSRLRGRASQGRPAVAARAAPSRSASTRRVRHGARAQSKVIR